MTHYSDVSFLAFVDGFPCHKTACGEVVNDPVGLVVTDDYDEVDCVACKRKRPKGADK